MFLIFRTPNGFASLAWSMLSVFALSLVCLPLAGLGAALAQDAISSPYGAPQHQWASPASGAWGSSAGIERGPHGEIWACLLYTSDAADE